MGAEDRVRGVSDMEDDVSWWDVGLYMSGDSSYAVADRAVSA